MRVLISGASSGIGYATSAELLERGHRVVGLSRRGTGPEHRDFEAVKFDFSGAGLDQRLDKLLRSLGPFEAVVSNVGAPIFGYLEQLSASQIEAGLDINLKSHVLFARAALPHLKKRDESRLIFVGSEAAWRGGKQGAIYCAAKFGLRGFALALREECQGSGVHISIVHPGPVRTPWFDSLEFAPGPEPENAIEPEDVARVIADTLAMRAGTVVDEVLLSPLKRVVARKKSSD